MIRRGAGVGPKAAAVLLVLSCCLALCGAYPSLFVTRIVSFF